ncbi:MAG: ATP-dependent DNA helicase [Actinomycetota bacterium]|nr:ATP-dependent DNA helicase [Actinomycetota bacterium]
MTRFQPTPEQQAIIAYALEPLRVAAGAGTGKTTTIVERIAHLVGAGVDPARILGVTFTNKAADELSQRVIAALGDAAVEGTPEIATYHGFASSILDEFGVFTGYGRASMLMDEGHRAELASRVLRETDTTDLDLTSLPTRSSEMLKLASAMTDNLVDFSALLDLAPREPDEVWTKRLALAEAVAHYEKEKRRLGLVEYGDLIRFAVEVIEGVPNVASEVSSRYDVVVLDEYQDTDPAQRRLLMGLFASVVPVVGVGDSDQTIYEWRGASAENFEAFPTDFPRSDGSPAATLPLSVNRRSDRLIIEMANRVRGELPDLAGALPLAPGPDALRGEIVTGWFNSEESEARWIAEQMHLRHAEGVAWRAMAILCRKRSQFTALTDALTALDTPFAVASMGQLLQVPEIADLVAWLRILSDPSRETSLLRVWLGGRFRLGMADVAVLQRWCLSDPSRTLFDAAAHRDDVDSLTAEARQRLDSFVSIYGDLRKRAQVATVPDIIGATIDALGFWDEVAALRPGPALTAKLNLSKFVETTQRWRPIEGAPSLAGFLSYLTVLDESGRADELNAASPPVPDAVGVLTVHAAKGLEWSDVYLPGLAHGVFPGRVHVRDNPDKIPYMLPYASRLDPQTYRGQAEAPTEKEREAILNKQHVTQEWRLAYVAVTRAEHRLVLCGHAWDGTIKNPRTPSAFFAMAGEIGGSTRGPREEISDTQPEREQFVELPVPPDPFFAAGPADALRNIVADDRWIAREHPELAGVVEERVTQLKMAVEDLTTPAVVEPARRFVTSVTNLVVLAACPQRFKWIHHDRLPRRPTRSATLGTAFHRQVELHNLGVIAFGDPSDATYDSESDGRDSRERSTADPWQVFAKSRFLGTKPLLAEAPFEISVGEGSIRGKVDAIYEPDPEHWEIVDYKSGRHREDPSLGVQLEVYAVAAADGALSGTPPVTMDVTFAYFGGGKLVEVTETVDEAWLARARRNVTSLVEQGADGPFTPNPSEACRWCDFLHLCPAGQNFMQDQERT